MLLQSRSVYYAQLFIVFVPLLFELLAIIVVFVVVAAVVVVVVVVVVFTYCN